MRIVFIAFLFSTLVFFSVQNVNKTFGLESYARTVPWTCSYSYYDEEDHTKTRDCYVWNTQEARHLFDESEADLGGIEVTKLPLKSSVDMLQSGEIETLKSKLRPSSIPQERYDNVGEPSFASNGSLIFFTGNHYAARAKVGDSWQYVDPYIDFKGIEPANFSGSRAFDLFWADQHTEYDKNHDMYTWIRQGEVALHNGWVANIDRIGVSRNTINWTVYDLLSTLVLKDAGIIQGFFDYPETVITNEFLYITTSVFNNNVFPMEVYGAIFRIALDDLDKALLTSQNSPGIINPQDLSYELTLDRDVAAITPVEGASDPMYFGAHIPSNSSGMKLYQWHSNAAIPNTRVVPITSWNSVNNQEICKNSDDWWCEAKTSSRIRSAILFNNSLNFWWNSLTTYDNGKTWSPYIDSASFELGKDLAYNRKYYLSSDASQWIFGDAATNNNTLGIGAYYVDNKNANSREEPYLNFAFGVFDDTTNKWNMVPIINSSAPLPVKNETLALDYNFGDFLTTRAHEGNDGRYRWDLGAYVIVGRNYTDIEPYFIMVN